MASDPESCQKEYVYDLYSLYTMTKVYDISVELIVIVTDWY